MNSARLGQGDAQNSSGAGICTTRFFFETATCTQFRHSVFGGQNCGRTPSACVKIREAMRVD